MISKYIDNKELKRIVEEGNLKPYKVKNATKEQGILFVSIAPEVIAQQIYPIFWGCRDMTDFRDSIDDSGNYIKSSLIEFNVHSSNNILDILEESIHSINGCGHSYSFGSLTRLKNDQINMRLKFPKSRVGKNEIMSTQDKYIDIYVKKIDDEKAVFDIRQASVTEMKEINKCLEEIVKSNTEISMRHINLENLTKENRITFFDTFNVHKFKDWKFMTVTKMELKKDNAKEDDDEITLGDDESTSNNLRGITSAIVSGTSLRTNSFIQDCLKNKFSIAVMEYKFEHISSLMKVVIELNLKHSDLKVDISRTFEYDEIEKKERVHPLLIDQQEDIIKIFQSAAYKIYCDIIEKQKTQAVNINVVTQ